jgi:CrcB protein
MQSHWSPLALAAVGFGGAAGSILRYVLGALLQRAGTGFPYGTLGVNVTGSFLLGALLPALVARGSSPELRPLLTIGLCGGYTTFSTFAYETALMIQDDRLGRAGAYVVMSTGLTIAAMFAGFAASRALVAFGR